MDLELNWFDAAALGAILLSLLFGLARGFIQEVCSIIALIAATWATLYGLPIVLPYAQQWIDEPLGALAVAALGLFAVVFLIVSVLINILRTQLLKSDSISALDRVAGAGFGALRGFIIMSLAVLLILGVVGDDARPPWLEEARLFPYFNAGANALSVVAPQALESLRQAPVLTDPPKDI